MSSQEEPPPNTLIAFEYIALAAVQLLHKADELLGPSNGEAKSFIDDALKAVEYAVESVTLHTAKQEDA